MNKSVLVNKLAIVVHVLGTAATLLAIFISNPTLSQKVSLHSSIYFDRMLLKLIEFLQTLG